ncbi:MAG TPA: pentapeptide repeat-containing protein [Trebonia sp.]|nr:pentapeptide repeat-containing protein [Trebonia sp.]
MESSLAAHDRCVVRVLGPDGSPVGAGVLIGGRRIVTCAHVVNAALGLDQRAQDRPVGQVSVDFPALSPGQARPARIAAWVPPPRQNAAGDDVAGLELTVPPPPGTAPARLAIEIPRPGTLLHLPGFPPDIQNGTCPTATVSARVAGGRLQLDASADATRIQVGFSGGPVVDDDLGVLAGIISAPQAAAGIFAITADRLRLAWPELSSSRARPGTPRTELTILHVSDPQFGKNHLFGGNGLTTADQAADTLFGRLHRDLGRLAAMDGLRPDLMVVTGDLAEWGMRGEFAQVTRFLAALSEAAGIPRRHVAIVPGNHDINRTLCQAYFLEQAGNDAEPVPPYWPKWKHFEAAFRDFYADVPGVTFTPDEPWTLFRMPDLNVVVAGLNSTMAESHRDSDHYGWIGEHQLEWFADRLREFKSAGYLRIAAVHHNAIRGAVSDEENLRDPGDLDRILGRPRLVSLLLHGHTHDAQLHYLPSGLAAVSTGSAAVNEAARPTEVPNQYQLITVRHDRFTRHARSYATGQKRWIGDTRISDSGSHWQAEQPYALADVDAAFPAPPLPPAPLDAPVTADQPATAARDAYVAGRDIIFGDPARGTSGPPRDSFLSRAAEATRARSPGATVYESPDSQCPYLRVSQALEAGGVEQWPVGVVDGPVTGPVLAAFAAVHAKFAAADPQVRSELVYTGPAASAELATQARRLGFRLRTFVDYQGLLDLGPLDDAQRRRLAEDLIYPSDVYVEQRFRVSEGSRAGFGAVRTGLISQAVDWLHEDGARLVVVLGDFGRGKTSFLRQLTRKLPEELPGVLPILVELRKLEKAPTLIELLAQHVTRNGVKDFNPDKLRYMIESGRVALLFDGFDELELRVGYDNAADYLKTLLDAVQGRANIILTSRTQHFRSTDQVRTQLGATIETRSASRVVILEDFSEDQIMRFLTNIYGGDGTRAQARFALLGEIENLLDLAHNPRMLTFIGGMDDKQLQEVRRSEGRLTQAALYREIIDFWLRGEAERQQHDQGIKSFDQGERLQACAALALKLWASPSPTIGLPDLTAEVAATLTGLAERGYSESQATHSIASGSLLVRTEDGAFAFIHQSIMEWLVADMAARDPGAQILSQRRMSRLMVDFYVDLAAPATARQWANAVMSDREAPETAKQNALAVRGRLGGAGQATLVRVDLRDQDLTGRDFSGADLRGATLRGMRLSDVNLAGADLSGADFSGARLSGGSLRGANLAGSNWTRAAILGADGVADLYGAPELLPAAIVGRDPVDVMIRPPVRFNGITYSPDATLLAVASPFGVEIIDATDGRCLRILREGGIGVLASCWSPDGTHIATASADQTARIFDAITGRQLATLTGHDYHLSAVAWSPDGTHIATASKDGTARIWDAVSGEQVTTLIGHDHGLDGVAWSPDGGRVATASADQTARIWDAGTGEEIVRLAGHSGYVRAVAWSPDGTHIATASWDGTARTWGATTGQQLTTLTGHDNVLGAVAWSPDGTHIATASKDGTARTWDATTGQQLTTLTGHDQDVRDVAWSPDGTHIATASADGTARVWDAAAGALRMTLTGSPSQVTGVAFSPDDAFLATASFDRTPRIWDVTTGRRLTTLIGHDEDVYAVAWSPDGTHIATASDDGTARTWDATTGQQLTTLTGHNRGLRAIAWSPDGTHIATASADGTARIWATTGWHLATLTGHDQSVRDVGWSPDGTHIATASADGTARTWDATTGQQLTSLTGHNRGLRAIAWSPDGTHIATASDDGTARTWSVTTGRQLTMLAGHHPGVTAIAWSHDGTRVATASFDDTSQIWDSATGVHLATLVDLPDGGYAALLPDGRHKIAGNPTDRVWWAIKLCRFEAGELDPYVPSIRRLPADAPIFPGPS